MNATIKSQSFNETDAAFKNLDILLNITQEISPIRETVINSDVHNSLLQTIAETESVINPDLHTPLASNKKDNFQHHQQQITNICFETHLKCEVSNMKSRIDLLSEVIENKVNVLRD